ncbi:RQC-minor-1 family DNA-binding protein [Aquisalimonas sp.]|uniref:RQC domain-containing protein n=1 Tax=Aquisalimonas sp. TaxID=1872621 RepID=UPI0025BAEF84|nr:RQC-minor-1 family DNA-binding protein [Aquisalimonas sp.]
MGRRVHRVPYQLQPESIDDLPRKEIVAILRGADDLIMRAGRRMLAKVLKGSRDKRVVELKLDQSPVYGYYRVLSENQILARIDWVIAKGYLDIEYDYRLPMLVYTPRGWVIEKETYARELLQRLDALCAQEPPYAVEGLRDKNREVIWRLLDLIEASGDTKYVPVLRAWQDVDYRKVRARIHGVIQSLTSTPT